MLGFNSELLLLFVCEDESGAEYNSDSGRNANSNNT